MSRRDLLIGLQHATQQGIKMREGTNLAEMGEIKPLSLSPKVAAAKSKFGGDKPIDTTGVAGGERSSTGLGMNTTRPSSGGISSRNAGIAPGQRSSTGLGMNTEEYRMKAISDAIFSILSEEPVRSSEKQNRKQNTQSGDAYNPLEKDIGVEWMERSPYNQDKQKFSMIRTGRSLNPAGAMKDAINRAARDEFTRKTRFDDFSDIRSPASQVPYPERMPHRENKKFFTPPEDSYLNR